MNTSADAIFAYATPPGRSGVAVLRVSGARTRELFPALGVAPLPHPRRATLARLTLPATGEALDDTLALWFPAPASFTGEDVAELHTHGGRAVKGELLEALGGLPGFRPALPGEFARRAFANGKMDLTRAEGLADLIDAETAAQKRQALRQMRGALEQTCQRLREGITAARAHLEAYLDFPDEDIPADVLEGLEQGIAALAEEVRRRLAGGGRGAKIREGYSVALAGAPNAGKSTLLNALAGRDIAIVSDAPGTTRDVLEAHLDIGGFACVLADAAGIRATTDAVEAEGVRRARRRAEEADLRLLVLDATLPLEAHAAILALKQQDDVVVWNKIDAKPLHIVDVEGCPALELSAKTGEGMESLLSCLERRMRHALGGEEEGELTRARHRQAFMRALTALEAAQCSKPLELVAEDLRHASNALGEMIGVIGTEDILEGIFSRFCIGK